MEEFRYNSDGEKLKKFGDCWIPEDMILTNEQSDCDLRITRPKFNLINILLNILLPIIICILIGLLFVYIFNITTRISILSVFIIFIGYLLIRMKSIIIFTIRLYQKFAPLRIRSKCVFTPTCSEYMILAIKKYGIAKGVVKGIKRIKRCSGEFREDYP